MEFINTILKRDASYASKNMVVDMSVTTSTTKLAMRANISNVGVVCEPGANRCNAKSPSSQQSDCPEVGAVDNGSSLPLDNSKCPKLTPFEKPLYESAIMSDKTTKEVLSSERSSEKVTRDEVSEDGSPQKVHPVQKQTFDVVGGTIHLSLVPFDVKNAPLSFTQMEQIQATIIDMMIEHNRQEINAESLNCQFKTGWMSFKCSTATAEWLKHNCNDISKKCKVKLNVVDEIDQDKNKLKQNHPESTRPPRLKKRYYLALHHLKELNKAKANGVPLKNANFIRTKYESMLEDYLKTQKNERRLRKLLVREGVLDRPKKARPLDKRYRMALNRLEKLKKIEESGTLLDEPKLRRRRRLQTVVDEYLREQANSKMSTGGSPSSRRPFHEVITDPMCVAVGGKRKGLFVPIPNEWPTIESQINELVTSCVSENQDDGPRYDMSEVHRGFRVIKCMDEFSKKFLFKSIASLKDKWKELNLMIIPASQIPRGRREPIDLKGEKALKKIYQTININSSKSVKTIPSASFSTPAENMDFQTHLQFNETRKTAALQDHGMGKPENQHPQTSNPFRSLDLQTSQYHDLTEKTIISNIHCVDNTENSPSDLPIKRYLAQEPQTSRKADEFSPTSWRTNNYLNSAVESDVHDRFPASNRTSRRSAERKLTQNQTITKSKDWWKTCDVRDNSGSDRTQFYQDSLPDYSNPYSIDRLPTSSRRSSERNLVQTHTLNSFEDWQRSPDFYETTFYSDSPHQYSNPYRKDRWLESNEISMRNREGIPFQSQTLANSESRGRSSPSGCKRSRYRNERELSPNEILMSNRKRNSTLMDYEGRRKSPDFHTKLTRSYEDVPPHYSNSNRILSSSDSFETKYHKPDSFDILSTEATKYNVRGKESYRSNEFHDVSRHRGFESFPDYFSQLNSRNKSYGRRGDNYFPSDDDEIPPPPPKWN